MSNRTVLCALVFSCFVFGQSNSPDRKDRTNPAAVEAPLPGVIGNEKTVGGSPQPVKIQRSDDDNIVGNAKAVGGTASYSTAAVSSMPEDVGNSKTVGGR